MPVGLHGEKGREVIEGHLSVKRKSLVEEIPVSIY